MKPRVMIVEDDLAVLEALKLMLEDYYEVIVALNGREAIALYEKFKPDLVLMDISMPDVDGVEATKAYFETRPKGCYSLRNCFCSPTEAERFSKPGQGKSSRNHSPESTSWKG